MLSYGHTRSALTTPFSHHDLLQLAMYKQTTPIPLFTNEPACFLQPHVVSLPLCYFSPILRVLYIPHVLCLPLGSRFLVLCFSRLSSPWSIPAVLFTPFPQCSRKPSVLSVFTFSPITRGLRYHIFILSYYEARSRPFLLVAHPQRSAVFSLTPLCQSTVNLALRFSLCTYILSVIPPRYCFPFFSRFPLSLLPRSSTLQIHFILLSVFKRIGVYVLFSLTTSQKLAGRDFY